MEFVEQERSSEACNLLEVPGFSSLDVDDDEGEVVIGIRPKSSPLPRRKSSVSDEDSEPEPPMCGSRRVSFADAKGLSLVQVKEFEMWDVPNLPMFDFCEGEGKDKDKYHLSLLTFSRPLSTEELSVRVQDQKVELETIELLPGTTILKGVIRVLNISFTKAVYVRTTLDTWSSYFDLLAEYIPGSSDGLMDCFSFRLTLVPPFGEQGARVDFCLRYETPVGTFWANNNHRNYVLFCHQRMRELKESPQKENVNKKSCLKLVSQNLSGENISMVDASIQENISTVVAKQGDEVNTVKDKQTSDDQSGESADDEQKLRAGSRQNRSRRKAVRMARVRDYFAQRDGGENDTERDESPPSANPEEVEKKSKMHFVSASCSKSEGFEFVSGLDASQGHNYTSNSEPEKSENDILADSAILAGGESAMDIPDDEEPASAEWQNINKSVSKDERNTLKQHMNYDHARNVASGPFDSVVSGISSESVAAPMNYKNTFGRMESENQNVGDMENPERSSPERQELTQSELTEIRESSVIETQKSNQECLDASSESRHIEQHTSVTANEILERADMLQDPAEMRHSDDSRYEKKPLSADRQAHRYTGNILNTDFANALVPKESLYPQTEAQEDSLTCDLQRQALAERAETQLPEHECSQIKPNVIVETSHQLSVLKETKQQAVVGCEIGKTTTISTTSVISEDQIIKALQSLNPKNNSVAQESCCSFCCEIVHENDKTTHESEKQIDDVEEQNQLMMNYFYNDETKQSADEVDFIHGDTYVQFKEQSIKSEKTQLQEMEVEQEDFSFTASTEVKNWEMMVEEEENITLTYDEESIKTEDDEAAVKDIDRQLTNKGIVTVFKIRHAEHNEKEKRDEGFVEEVTATGKKEGTTKDADCLKDKTIKNMTEEDKVDVELLYVQAAHVEMIVGEDGPIDETEVEKKEEQEKKERHFIEVSLERSNVQKVGAEEEMEKDPNGEDKARVQWEDQVNPREKSENNNQNYREEMLAGAGEAEIVDAESDGVMLEGTEDEVVCCEDTQNIAKDSFSAPVSNLYNRDKDKPGEGHHAHIVSEVQFYAEEGFQTTGNDTHEKESTGCLCISEDEPESDQRSRESTSAESDSDDEVELYMHCLRAVHTGPEAHTDRNKDATGVAVRKRPSVSKSQSTPMPSISESLDEEHLSSNEDTEKKDNQPTTLAGGQEHATRNVSRCKESFSCSKISKTLLYVTLLVVFLVVAYHYDFLACVGLYLISVIWLCCQGETQPVKNNNRLD